MLSHPTLVKLSNLIKAIASSETEAETSRQILCEKTYFEPYATFKRLSGSSANINSDNLLSFFEENNIRVSRSDIYYLIRLFDSNNDGKLSYNEFLSAVLTRSNASLRKEAGSRRSSSNEENESHLSQIRLAIAKIFETELESGRKCDAIRQELMNCKDFSVMNAFKDIDVKDHGYIDVEKIAKLMELVGTPLEASQIEAFMLRADKTACGLLRYPDFLELFHSTNTGYAVDRPEPEPEKEASILGFGSSAKKQKRETNYFEQLKDRYTSPKKDNTQYATPAKLGTVAVENMQSPPQSTMASWAVNNTTSFKTPAKKSVARVLFEEAEQQVLNQSAQDQRKSGSFYSVNFTPRKASPMKPKEEMELVKALKEMLDQIHVLEGLKNDLAVREDFNGYNAFAIFDTEKRGCITVQQLEKGFENLHVHCARGDIKLLMKRLDTDLDGLATFEDFSQVMAPKTAEFAKLTYHKKITPVPDLQSSLKNFSRETLDAYRSFLVALVEGESHCESIRQRLVNRKTFNMHDAFGAIDRYGNGFVTAEHFNELCKEKGLFFSQKDLNSLVERYSKSARGKVSYYEFIKEMTPKSIEKY